MKWQPIETIPHNKPVILANFDKPCLLSGTPHVWAGALVTKWKTLDDHEVTTEPTWVEYSLASINCNGAPTHWAEMPGL